MFQGCLLIPEVKLKYYNGFKVTGLPQKSTPKNQIAWFNQFQLNSY